MQAETDANTEHRHMQIDMQKKTNRYKKEHPNEQQLHIQHTLIHIKYKHNSKDTYALSHIHTYLTCKAPVTDTHRLTQPMYTQLVTKMQTHKYIKRKTEIYSIIPVQWKIHIHNQYPHRHRNSDIQVHPCRLI